MSGGTFSSLFLLIASFQAEADFPVPLTLNQRVAGSIPASPTNKINKLTMDN